MGMSRQEVLWVGTEYVYHLLLMPGRQKRPAPALVATRAPCMDPLGGTSLNLSTGYALRKDELDRVIEPITILHLQLATGGVWPTYSMEGLHFCKTATLSVVGQDTAVLQSSNTTG